MDILIIVILIFSLIANVILLILFRLDNSALLYNEELIAKLKAKNQYLTDEVEKHFYINLRSEKLLIDHQTYSLISLAVNNSNENEARTAAMKACKRVILQIQKNEI